MPVLTIQELYRNKVIDHRTYIFCQKCGFNSVDDLRGYFEKNGTFLNLLNCGLALNGKLMELIRHHVERATLNLEELMEKYMMIPPMHRAQILSLLDHEIKKLSSRSRRVLSKHVGGEIGLLNLSERVLSQKLLFTDFQGISKRSGAELEVFRMRVHNILTEKLNAVKN